MTAAPQAEPSCSVQGQFGAALKDVVEAVNARHSMCRAIAAYTSLRHSAPHPCSSSSSAAKREEDTTALCSTDVMAQQFALNSSRTGIQPQQCKADNTADTVSEKSEQTTDIADVARRASCISIAQ